MTTPGGSEPSGGPVATARQQFPKGYAQIADLHGKIPETIHLRTHTRLFVQVLLDKQARLQDLDEELRQQQLADQTSAIGKRSEYCRNFGLMRATGEGDEFEQRRILDDIEKIVVDYGEPPSEDRWDQSTDRLEQVANCFYSRNCLLCPASIPTSRISRTCWRSRIRIMRA